MSWFDSAFQWTSAVATCGFSVAPAEQMAPGAIAVMVVGMLIGGMVGSTAGGLKIERLLVLAQGLWGRIRRRPPRIRTDDGWFDGEAARERFRTAAKLATLLMISVVAGTFGLAVLDEVDRPLLHHLFEASSAIGCVGLSSGVTAHDLATGAKLILTALMWIGRLEVVAVLTLVASPLPVGQQPWLPDEAKQRSDEPSQPPVSPMPESNDR
jgi:trk system potassium uptake protein TrkH